MATTLADRAASASGSARDGKVIAYIPDPEPDPDHTGSTGGEGIAEFGGVIYGFGDHRQKLPAQRRYVKNSAVNPVLKTRRHSNEPRKAGEHDSRP